MYNLYQEGLSSIFKYNLVSLLTSLLVTVILEEHCIVSSRTPDRINIKIFWWQCEWRREMSHGCQVLVWGGEGGPAKYILTHWQARPVRLPNIETPIDKFTDNCHCKNLLIIFFLQFPFRDCENDMTSPKLIS